MLSSALSVALWSATTFALANERRRATDDAQFTSAAEQLISQYIPSTVLPALESSVSSAASGASVAGAPLSLIYDALLAISVPKWFESAIPTEWSTQIAALESGVDALRPTPSSGPVVPIVIAVTTTDSAGSTFTTSVTSTPSKTASTTVTSTETSGLTTTTGTTVSVNGGGVYSSLTTKVVGGVTSVYETAVSRGSSVATEASGVVSHASTGASGVVSHASSVATEASGGVSQASTGASGVVSHASSVATEASGVVSHASSVATAASGFISSATSTGAAGVPTAISGAAAGVIGMFGLMIAL